MSCPECNSLLDMEEQVVSISDGGLRGTFRYVLYCPKCGWPHSSIAKVKTNE